MIGMTVCSGVGAPEVAAPWVDWRYQSEIEPFPCAVLAERFPNAVNLGDMTKFQEWPDANVDVLCGGTPCQAFSVAGLRKGLADPRGNLMLTYLAIAARYRPRWLVWENVPGVLSSNGGKDFGAFLGGLGELGYGFAYRVLDVQFGRTLRFPFAIPQRRRRVFVVGYLGDWRRAAAVLFDRESLSGNPPPRRDAGQNASPTLSARTKGGGGLGSDFEIDGGLTPETAGTLRAEGFDASEGGTGRQTLIPSHDPACTLTARDYKGPLPEADLSTVICVQAVAFHPTQEPISSEGVCHTLGANANATAAVAFDLRGRDGGAMPEGPHETANIRAASGGSSRSYVCQMQGTAHGHAYEADASSALSVLREKVGAEAFQKWGLRVLECFQSQEILRSWLHGESLRDNAEDFKSFVDDCPLSRQEGYAGESLFALWRNGPNGRSPQGRGLAKQLAGEPGEALSVLPHEGTQPEGAVSDMRRAHEGARILRQALSEMEEVGRPRSGEGEPAHERWCVRRLTPLEAERLMGFQDGWTQIAYRGKPADKCPDGPRYKALGNSWGVNAGEYVFDRIRMVEGLT